MSRSKAAAIAKPAPTKRPAGTKKATAPKKAPLSVSGGTFPPPTVTAPGLLVDGSDALFREFVGALFDLGSQVRELRLYLAGQLGVSEPQYRLVIAIAQLQKQDGISVSALAEYLWVSNSFITIEIGKLEQLGWVEKTRNPGDGRGVLLRLTPVGRAAYLKVVGTIQLINDTKYGHLDKDALGSLLVNFKLILKNGRRALDIARIAASQEDTDNTAAARPRRGRG